MRIVVFHSSYGCDTGCCGHTVASFADAVAAHPDFSPYLEESLDEDFEFEHPNFGESFLEFARRLVTAQYGAEHVADLDWESCLVSHD